MVLRDSFTRLAVSCGITLALLVGMGAAAKAQEVTVIKRVSPEDTLTQRVTYADLNLASAAGERTLVRRVGSAVGAVCSPHTYVIDGKICRTFAWNGAQPQIDRAVARATQIATNGTSSIPPVAIVIAAPR